MIDDFQAGKLVAHVDKCNDAIERLTKNVEELEDRLEALDKALAKGRGMYAGVLLAMGVGISALLNWSKLFGGN
jgi:cell division septum initiation protein DivIVA